MYWIDLLESEIGTKASPLNSLHLLDSLARAVKNDADLQLVVIAIGNNSTTNLNIPIALEGIRERLSRTCSFESV